VRTLANRIYLSQREFLICRTTLGYPRSTRGDALGFDTVRFVEPLHVKFGDDDVQIESIGSGTISCGFAPSMEALIAARAVAGMGGGGFVLVFRIDYSGS
jgi:hypothetical protein